MHAVNTQAHLKAPVNWRPKDKQSMGPSRHSVEDKHKPCVNRIKNSSEKKVFSHKANTQKTRPTHHLNVGKNVSMSKESRPSENFTYTKGFACMYTNADSLLNKLPELKLRVKNLNPCIVAVTEINPKHTRFSPTEPELQIENYDLFFNTLNSSDSRGCALYVKKDMGASAVTTFANYGDQVWCQVNLNNTDTMLIGCIYRSPNSTYENNAALNQMLIKAADLKFSHLLILGDFNYPEIDWLTWSTPSDNPMHKGNVFIETIRDCYLYQHVTKPTRCRSDQIPHVLDLVLTNEEGMIQDLEHQSPLGKSDHGVLVFQFICYLIQKNLKKKSYIYHKGDYAGLKNSLNIDWQNHLDSHSINDMWGKFKSKVKDGIEEFIPSVVQRQGNKHKVPLNPSDIKKIKKKHRAWQRYVETRDGKKYLEYCKLRNQVRNITRHAQKNKEHDIADQAKSNPKFFWKYVKSKTKVKDGIGNLDYMDEDGNKKTTVNDLEKAQVLNKFFASVFTQEPPDQPPKFDNRNYTSVLDELKVTRESISKLLKDLKICKSPGPDEIHPRLLQELHVELATPLHIIYTKSLDTGELPDEWKEANVTAIFKKGSKNSPSNYRPVSLTCIACKLVETVVRNAIYNHMVKNNLFSKKQFGFLSKRSTTLQLLTVLDHWTKILDEGSSVDNIYMDFMKAFDTVPHRRLLQKIRSYGISGKAEKWVEAFLSNRRQRVCINGCHSEWESVASGIPQGSVLGPLLFVIFINDLPEVVSEASCIFLFADDTKIYREIRSEEDCVELQNDLVKLEEWSNKWLLKFHPEKCKVIEFGRAQLNFSYSLQGIHLEHVQKEKDIGVIVDNKLKFEYHINEKIKKANCVMGIIRRSFQFMDHTLFKKLFKAMVRPHLEYANPTWSPQLKKHITAIENVQRRATKLIPGMKNLSYQERLKELKLPSLTYRRLRGDMIEVYKITSGLYDPEVSGILPTYESRVEQALQTRGHNKKLFRQHCKSNLRKRFFTQRIIDTWNGLPSSVVNAPSLLTFERRLDKHWENQDVMYDFKASLTKSKKAVGAETYETLENNQELSITQQRHDDLEIVD